MTDAVTVASIPHAPPASAANFLLCVLGLLAGLGTLAAAALGDPRWTAWLPYQPLLPCLAVAVTIITGERLLRARGRLAPTGLAAERLRRADPGRTGLRMVGLGATVGLLAFAYWLLPEYRGGFYTPYWNLLTCLAPLALLVPWYVLMVDACAREPDDDLVAFGRLVLGRGADADSAAVRRHLLGWLVKGFFLPLMAVYLDNEYQVIAGDCRSGLGGALRRFDFWFHLGYLIDLLFCVIGYTAALRLFDSQIRSVDATMLGWVAALLCYQPFYSVFGQLYFQYEGGILWDSWLRPWPLLQGTWGAVIITLVLFYGFCTVAFGLRFSNLTHRGIITSGPYRYLRHPAYLAKNLSWWLISVPFLVHQNLATTLRHCLCLLLLNGVYLLRAKTEERHLGQDPTYRDYARWIDEHGMLRKIGKIWPWLKFNSPA